MLTVIRELKVENVFIGKQFEDSENYHRLLEIAKEKKIKIIVVESGSKINIERNLFFKILWPDSKSVVSENSINNNALVCKLYYKDFTMLFTGDIEEEAEKILVPIHENTSNLKSTVLKIAHHGSNSSSIDEFLKLVKPSIALIGVGENNLYGHPSTDVITRLQNLRN